VVSESQRERQKRLPRIATLYALPISGKKHVSLQLRPPGATQNLLGDEESEPIYETNPISPLFSACRIDRTVLEK
jgi:hypothetical protein